MILTLQESMVMSPRIDQKCLSLSESLLHLAAEDAVIPFDKHGCQEVRSLHAIHTDIHTLTHAGYGLDKDLHYHYHIHNSFRPKIFQGT